MRIVADFHIHSRFSRATSREMSIPSLISGAKKKGIQLLGSGDFTHPGWLLEIEQNLTEDGSGFLLPTRLDSGVDPRRESSDKSVKFILSAEISAIYTKGEKVRKIHLVLLSPSIEEVKKINWSLSKIGNLSSDGRPIFGADVEKLCGVIFDQSPETIIIPGHIWTPWFSLFGSNSGFDQIRECFGRYADQIYAYETGLSSDPEMNWRVSQLDNLSLISNSDAHSLGNLMREANIFEVSDSLTFSNLRQILKNKDTEKLKLTIEFFPEEGKYHWDGHRACNIVMEPAEALKNNNLCPVCKRQLTLGVDHRVEELADRERGQKPFGSAQGRPEKVAGVLHLVPLAEILSQIYHVGADSNKVSDEIEKLISHFGSEFAILVDALPTEIEKAAGKTLAQAVENMRAGKVHKEQGYDGVYGKILVDLSGTEAANAPQQLQLL